MYDMTSTHIGRLLGADSLRHADKFRVAPFQINDPTITRNIVVPLKNDLFAP
jgi:hypothetical protein